MVILIDGYRSFSDEEFGCPACFRLYQVVKVVKLFVLLQVLLYGEVF